MQSQSPRLAGPSPLLAPVRSSRRRRFLFRSVGAFCPLKEAGERGGRSSSPCEEGGPGRGNKAHKIDPQGEAAGQAPSRISCISAVPGAAREKNRACWRLLLAPPTPRTDAHTSTGSPFPDAWPWAQRRARPFCRERNRQRSDLFLRLAFFSPCLHPYSTSTRSPALRDPGAIRVPRVAFVPC